MFLILILFFNFCHKNLHIFALPSSAVLKPAQAGLVFFQAYFKQTTCSLPVADLLEKISVTLVSHSLAFLPICYFVIHSFGSFCSAFLKLLLPSTTILYWLPHGIALSQAISDFNNQIIRLSKLSYPLNIVSFSKQDMLKLPKLILLSDW